MMAFNITIFPFQTWLCLTFTILVIGPLLYAVNYLTPYNDHFNIIKKGGLYKFGNCFWYIYGALLQQGIYKLFNYEAV